MTLTILQNAFLPPNPLTPRLTALGLNNKTAEVISRLYSSAALVLKEKYEAEYIGACNSIVATSESHGYSSKELRFKLLKVLTTRYTQEISKQMEEAFRMVGARFPKGYKNRAHMEVRTSDPYEDLKWLPENDDPKVVVGLVLLHSQTLPLMCGLFEHRLWFTSLARIMRFPAPILR